MNAFVVSTFCITDNSKNVQRKDELINSEKKKKTKRERIDIHQPTSTARATLCHIKRCYTKTKNDNDNDKDDKAGTKLKTIDSFI